MAVISSPLPALSPSVLSAFYTTDDLLSGAPVLIFYGPSATTTLITSTSRIQVHIYTPAGFQTFPRLTVSPSSQLYAAVNCLAREEQGDEICRALAFSLYKYFSELPPNLKEKWESQSNTLGRLPNAPDLFSEAHAAILATRMVKVENCADVIDDVYRCLDEQTLSWLDLDVVLPPGAMKALSNHPRESNLFEESEEDLAMQRYGEYAPVIKLFGRAAFLPTSKLRRAPSRSTGISRSTAFPRAQRENLRREMCELLDTEESYVSKIHDLVHSVAQEFRDKAKERNPNSSSPNAQALKGLFPPSLDEILEINTKFLEDIRAILEETENDAIQDIESATDDAFVVPQTTDHVKADRTGSLAFAKSLLAWFPKFADCYTSYIQAHSQFPQFLRIFTKETGSSFSKRVQETGEQRLTSMLIEPVQRLPRYNLYIDNIIKQLPAKHPALKSFLKARDIIADICSNDSPLLQQVKVLEALKRLVAAWPDNFHPQGRLITAMDVVEVAPPYTGELYGPASTASIFLLFSGHLVMLHKPSNSQMTSRALLAEVNNPKHTEATFSGRVAPELIFHHIIELDDAFFTEADGGNMLQLAYTESPFASDKDSRHGYAKNGFIKMYYLEGPYEGKASRWTEEFTKARVEGRFSEDERDSPKWEVRHAPGSVSLFSALFIETQDQKKIEGRKRPAMTRIVVDPAKGTKIIKFGEEGVEIAASLEVLGDDSYRLEIDGLNGYGSRDDLKGEEFLPVLTKKLSNLLQMRNHIRNPAIAATMLLRNQQILSSLKIKTAGPEEEGGPRESTTRSQSPVKMLSNLFSSSITRENSTTRKLQRTPSTLGDIPRILHHDLGRKHSRDGDIHRPRSAGRSTTDLSVLEPPTPALTKLEETLQAFVLALHARKGNIVGRVIRSRAAADELAVNELYNTLLEDPTNHESPAQESVDVLFAAFEKFLKYAWKEKMGPVISPSVLDALQSKSDSLYPGDFDDLFRQTASQLEPPNQRALLAIIKLLSDLLSGTTNDGDRGILTATFAEVLVSEGNPHDYVSLIDRFVEDADLPFSLTPSGLTTPNHGSLTSESRMRIGTSGSLSSNASSLRKKFGFGTLSRENSKSEVESKIGSVLRTLSKTGRGGDSLSSSISKTASIGRSKGADIDMRLSPKRPSSRDRPTVLGAFSFEHSPSHTNQSFMSLDTIGEVPAPTTGGPPRKKRRSSLSDLTTLQSSVTNTPSWSPHTPRKVDPARLRQESISPGTTPSHIPPATPSYIPGTPSHIPPGTPSYIPPATPSYIKLTQIPSPLYSTGSMRLGSPTRKENSPASIGHSRTQSLKSIPTLPKAEIIPLAPTPNRRRTETISGIPTFKSSQSVPLSERPTSGNVGKVPLSPTKSTATSSQPKKLRLQSTQKLRERLQNEQKAISSAHDSLQAELTKIGEEINKTEPTRPTTSHRTNAPVLNFRSSRAESVSSASISARVAAMQAEVASSISALTTRHEAIAADLTSSLQVSEARAKKIDELYREANAENEALYSRFNDELGRVLRNVKSGEGVEEMKTKLKEAQEEITRLKRENGRLKRENVGLRAQLRD